MTMKDKRCSMVAIQHPECSELYLHGKRNDNGKWTLPGGGQEKAEKPKETAIRELYEETGLEIEDLDFCCTKIIEKGGQKLVITLFSACCPENLNLTNSQDPDKELVEYMFLNPREIDNPVVPNKDNVLLRYLEETNE